MGASHEGTPVRKGLEVCKPRATLGVWGGPWETGRGCGGVASAGRASSVGPSEGWIRSEMAPAGSFGAAAKEGVRSKRGFGGDTNEEPEDQQLRRHGRGSHPHSCVRQSPPGNLGRMSVTSWRAPPPPPRVLVPEVGSDLCVFPKAALAMPPPRGDVGVRFPASVPTNAFTL